MCRLDRQTAGCETVGGPTVAGEGV